MSSDIYARRGIPATLVRVNASVTPDIARDPQGAAADAAARLRELTGAETHDVALVMGSGWAPAAEALGAPEHEFPVTELPGFPALGRRRTRRHDPLVPGRREAGPGLPGPYALLRGPWCRRGRAWRPYRRGGRLQDHRAHQRVRRSARGHAPRPAGPHQRPPQPDRHLPDRRRELRRPDGPVLAAAARAVQGGRPEPGGGRLRPVPRPALRDPGRDQDDPDAGRRPGRYVHGPGGHRGARGRLPRCSVSPW